MKALSKAILLLFLAAIPALAPAQASRMPQRNEIVKINIGGEDSGESIEVFNSPRDGANRYFLSVGHLGIGDEVVQIIFDPAFELFIPLGGTLDEAMETLTQLQDLYKTDPGTSVETLGCLAFGFPKDEKLETVKVLYRKVLLTKKLEFIVEREGYVRATYVDRSDLNSLARGVKFYKKLHPKE
ncbi:MAG: hypothetical protein IJ636_01560 [Bacteroidales bacterium]|nr:hypothetical protein [Bacteroidales bacterium]